MVLFAGQHLNSMMVSIPLQIMQAKPFLYYTSIAIPILLIVSNFLMPIWFNKSGLHSDMPFRSPENIKTPYSSKLLTNSPLTFYGISTTTFHENDPVSRFNSELIYIEPVKSFLFRVSFLNQIVFHSVKLETHILTGKSQHLLDVLPTAFAGGRNQDKSLTRARNNSSLGIIAGGEIKRLNWEIFKDGDHLYRVKSQRAFFEKGSRTIQMIDISFRNSKLKKTLISDRMIFDEQKNQFFIPGSYYTIYDDGKQRRDFRKTIKLDER